MARYGDRRWVLDSSLRKVLGMTLKDVVDEKVKGWLSEIEMTGEIDEEARAVLVAIGYLSSASDPRMTEAQGFPPDPA